MSNEINKTNYHTYTHGYFDNCDKPNREPDYISYDKSFVYYWHYVSNEPYKENVKSEDYEDWKNSDYPFAKSSSYWYEDGYLIRESDHWGEVASCCWEITHQEREGSTIGKTLFSEMCNIEANDLCNLEDGTYIVVEFGETWVCEINEETRNRGNIIPEHPSHYMNYVYYLD